MKFPAPKEATSHQDTILSPDVEIKTIPRAARRPYLAGLVSIDPEYPTPPYQGRGWHIDAVVHSYTQTQNKRGRIRYSRDKSEYGECYTSHIRDSKKVDERTTRIYTQPIIVIWAPTRIIAQEAANMMQAAASVLHGYLFIEDILAIPKTDDNLEDLDEIEYLPKRNYCFGTSGFATAAAIAAKCSHRARLTYALVKLWSSFRSCSRNWMEFHPKYGRAFGVTHSPVNHIIFSQAIVSAYSVIEELGLSIGTGKKAYDEGVLLPEIVEEVAERLRKAGINPARSFIWTARGPKTRIEKHLPLPSGSRTLWTKNSIRDRHISLMEAIARARWLRSKASAHESSDLTKSLTMVDVHNVQMTARRLLLERLGFLPGKPPRLLAKSDQQKLRSENN